MNRHKPDFSYFHHFFQCRFDNVDRYQKQTLLSLSSAIPVFTTCLDKIKLLCGVTLNKKKRCDVAEKKAMHDAITTKSLCLLGQCLIVLSRKQVLCKIEAMILQLFLHFWHDRTINPNMLKNSSMPNISPLVAHHSDKAFGPPVYMNGRNLLKKTDVIRILMSM